MPSFTMFGFKFFFWSNEYSGNTLEPCHIHFTKGVPRPDAPRYWINKDGRICADGDINLKASDRNKVEMAISSNYAKIINDWQEHFIGETITFNEKVFN